MSLEILLNKLSNLSVSSYVCTVRYGSATFARIITLENINLIITSKIAQFVRAMFIILTLKVFWRSRKI